MTAPVETPPGAPAPQPAPGAVDRRTYWSPVPQVNLLPSEILADRRFRRLRAQLIGTTVAVAALCLGGVVWAQLGLNAAQDDLAAVKGQGSRLEQEQAKYADVPRRFAALDQVKIARQQALGTDVLWYQFLGDLALNTPSDTELTSVVITMGGAGSGGAPVSPLTPSGLGTVSVTGTARRFPDVAAWLVDVNEVHGLTGSDLQSAAKSDAAGGAGDPSSGTSTGAPSGGSTGSSPGAGAGSSGGSGATGGAANKPQIKFVGTAVIEASALSHRYDRKAD